MGPAIDTRDGAIVQTGLDIVLLNSRAGIHRVHLLVGHSRITFGARHLVEQLVES